MENTEFLSKLNAAFAEHDMPFTAVEVGCWAHYGRTCHIHVKRGDTAEFGLEISTDEGGPIALARDADYIISEAIRLTTAHPNVDQASIKNANTAWQDDAARRSMEDD